MTVESIFCRGETLGRAISTIVQTWSSDHVQSLILKFDYKLRRGVNGIAENPATMAVMVVDVGFNAVNARFFADMGEHFAVVMFLDDFAILDKAQMGAYRQTGLEG